jgi:hypothetical protein
MELSILGPILYGYGAPREILATLRKPPASTRATGRA